MKKCPFKINHLNRRNLFQIIHLIQEGEEEGAEVVVPDQDMTAHYRDNTGPIRGYPGPRTDAFVWRPY